MNGGNRKDVTGGMEASGDGRVIIRCGKYGVEGKSVGIVGCVW